MTSLSLSVEDELTTLSEQLTSREGASNFEIGHYDVVMAAPIASVRPRAVNQTEANRLYKVEFPPQTSYDSCSILTSRTFETKKSQ